MKKNTKKAGGGQSPKFFSALFASFWSKNKGDRAPPGSSPRSATARDRFVCLESLSLSFTCNFFAYLSSIAIAGEELAKLDKGTGLP